MIRFIGTFFRFAGIVAVSMSASLLLVAILIWIAVQLFGNGPLALLAAVVIFCSAIVGLLYALVEAA